MGRKLTTEEWIEKAKLKHGNRYDYSKVVYTGKDNKVCIICKKHKEFWQTANDHKNGSNCPICAKEEGIRKRTDTLEEFISKARRKHGRKFDYNEVAYVNNKIPVLIKCNDCGYKFSQTPNSHTTGTGCPKCKTLKFSNIDFNIEIEYDNYKEEYIKLIKNAKRNPPEYNFDLHHILPKSIFPNWKDRESNLIKLSFEDHYKAHYLLYKIYDNYEMAMAFFLMFEKTNRRYDSKLYDEFRNKLSKQSGKKVYCFERDKIFDSMAEGARFVNLKNATYTSTICNNKKFNSTAGDCHWCYLEDKEILKEEINGNSR